MIKMNNFNAELSHRLVKCKVNIYCNRKSITAKNYKKKWEMYAQ